MISAKIGVGLLSTISPRATMDDWQRRKSEQELELDKVGRDGEENLKEKVEISE